MKIKDTIIILAIVTFMSLFSNVLGTKADIIQSIPGLLILAVIAFVGMLLSRSRIDDDPFQPLAHLKRAKAVDHDRFAILKMMAHSLYECLRHLLGLLLRVAELARKCCNVFLVVHTRLLSFRYSVARLLFLTRLP